MDEPLPFCGSPLDREALRRRERGWVERQLGDPASRYLPLWQGQPLLKREPAGLASAKREFFEDLDAPEPVLLGTAEGVAHFAADVSSAEKPEESFGIADVASFIESGESLEEAVRREILEEAGVRVGRVAYLFSQPWPFPSSLMLGCIAQAESEELHVDTVELEEARWFTRDALRSALAGQREGLSVPPASAIAHHLIRAWVERDPG